MPEAARYEPIFIFTFRRTGLHSNRTLPVPSEALNFKFKQTKKNSRKFLRPPPHSQGTCWGWHGDRRRGVRERSQLPGVRHSAGCLPCMVSIAPSSQPHEAYDVVRARLRKCTRSGSCQWGAGADLIGTVGAPLMPHTRLLLHPSSWGPDPHHCINEKTRQAVA